MPILFKPMKKEKKKANPYNLFILSLSLYLSLSRSLSILQKPKVEESSKYWLWRRRICITLSASRRTLLTLTGSCCALSRACSFSTFHPVLLLLSQPATSVLFQSPVPLLLYFCLRFCSVFDVFFFFFFFVVWREDLQFLGCDWNHENVAAEEFLGCRVIVYRSCWS
jgi:hypothetical protein